MNDREAIVAFEKQLHSAQAVLDSGFGAHPGESDSLYRRYKEMAEAALSVLQEREERSKGCEYCNGDVDERPFLDSEDLYISEDGWLTLSDEDHDFCKINFCPMCGRKLKTAMPGRRKYEV